MTITILISLLVGFVPPVADVVSNAVNKPVEVVTSIARQVSMVAIGLFFIYAGALAAGSLILGGALIAIGIALVAVAVWPWFKKSENPKNLGSLG